MGNDDGVNTSRRENLATLLGVLGGAVGLTGCTAEAEGSPETTARTSEALVPGPFDLPAGDLSGTGSTNAAPRVSQLTGSAGVTTLPTGATISQVEGGTVQSPSLETPLQLQPVDPSRAPWLLTLAGYKFSNTQDYVVQAGWNPNGAVSADYQNWIQWEQDFEVTPGLHTSECHLNMSGPKGSTLVRPWFAGYVHSGNGAPYSALTLEFIESSPGFGYLSLENAGVSSVAEWTDSGEFITPDYSRHYSKSYTLTATSIVHATLGTGTAIYAATTQLLNQNKLQLCTRAGVEFANITTSSASDRLILTVGSAERPCIEFVADQGTRNTQALRGSQRFEMYGTTSGNSAGVVSLGYAPATGHSASIRIVWNARDLTSGATYSRTVEGAVRTTGGVVTVAGSGCVNTGGDGDEALATAYIQLVASGSVVSASLIPPNGYASNLDWKGEVVIVED